MYIFSFDGAQLKYMLVGAANLLAENKAEIDALNVFPVPDGDTGTNMYLTMLAGVKEAQQTESDQIGVVMAAMAKGCLLGARGNSGVILSQIFSGFAQALAGKDRADAKDMAQSFVGGARAAYQAVSNPVEGTILTVCKETAAATEKVAVRSKDPVRVFMWAYRAAQKALEQTPELLPVLKEANVVDAGGMGFVVILEGIIRALKDAAAQRNIELFDLAMTQQKNFAQGRAMDYAADIEFVYCTEFILIGRNIPVDTLRQELAPYGDCLLVVGDDQTVKVHLHANHPGLVLECGLKYGALHQVQIDNMEEQSLELLSPTPIKSADKALGVVAVGVGEGIVTILQSMGVDVVVQGGQTMNPSADDLLQAINQAPADEVLVLPNNKNIVMAARQAAKMAAKTAHVVPATSIPQALAALLAYQPDAGLKFNLTKFNDALTNITTGYVTKAVRDAQSNGQAINKDDYIGLIEDQLVLTDTDLPAAVRGLIRKMQNPKVDLVTFYFGAGLSGTQAEQIIQDLAREHPDLDFELHYGGQPLYHFIISVE